MPTYTLKYGPHGNSSRPRRWPHPSAWLTDKVIDAIRNDDIRTLGCLAIGMVEGLSQEQIEKLFIRRMTLDGYYNVDGNKE